MFSSANLAAERKLWRRQFEYYIVVTRKDKSDKEVLVDVLITLFGADGPKNFDALVFVTEREEKKLQPVLEKFGDHFEPFKSEVC